MTVYKVQRKLPDNSQWESIYQTTDDAEAHEMLLEHVRSHSDQAIYVIIEKQTRAQTTSVYTVPAQYNHQDLIKSDLHNLFLCKRPS